MVDPLPTASRSTAMPASWSLGGPNTRARRAAWRRTNRLDPRGRWPPIPKISSSSPRSAPGAARTASWLPAFSAEALTQAVHDNLRNLGLDVLDVVNLRIMFDPRGPAEGSIEAPLTVLAEFSGRAWSGISG